jgi:hypothetical protein
MLHMVQPVVEVARGLSVPTLQVLTVVLVVLVRLVA